MFLSRQNIISPRIAEKQRLLFMQPYAVERESIRILVDLGMILEKDLCLLDQTRKQHCTFIRLYTGFYRFSKSTGDISLLLSPI